MAREFPYLPATVFAPMQGVGAWYSRDIFASYGGIGLMAAPFVRVTDQAPNRAWLEQQLHRSANLPLSSQLLGRNAGRLAETAAILSAAGADVIDFNLGCPSNQVVRKGAGSALLRELAQVRSIVAGLRAAVPGRLSVKIRAGDQTLDSAVETARLLAEEGVDWLTLHPRSRAQGYGGLADWSLVAEVRREVPIAVVGNGDLWYAADALELKRRSGCAAVMLGRPALRNPWIFRQIAELSAGREVYVPTGSDLILHLKSLAERFEVELAKARFGPLGALKEQLCYVLRGLPLELRERLGPAALKATSPDELWAILAPLSDAPTLDLGPSGPLRHEGSPLEAFDVPREALDAPRETVSAGCDYF